jgi:hypothetical protein
MKVVFDLTAGRLAIEGDGPELLKVIEAARLLSPSIQQIQIVTSSGSKDGTNDESGSTQETSGQPSSPRAAKTLRQFARSLSVDNAAERIAAIAYYVNKIEGKQSFSPKEMDGWFTMCGFQKPSQIGMALFDTKRKYGYADNVGRGMWRISNQGENLILAKLEENTERAEKGG